MYLWLYEVNMIADGEKGEIFHLLFVFMSLSAIGKVLRILAKVLGDPINIVYHYGEYTEIKNVDPERYSYVDVIYDAYCDVLKDIPSGKIIKFSIKAVLPNGDELLIEEDKDVMRMFEKSTDACDPIHYYVFGLEIGNNMVEVVMIRIIVNQKDVRVMGKMMKSLMEVRVVDEGVQILYLKNEKSKVTVVCCKRRCTWRIHASPTPDHTTYCVNVKSFNPKHSCGRVDTNKAASATWIARKLTNRLKVDPHMSIKAMKVAICAKYRISPNDKMLYRARIIANEENEGSFSKSYALFLIMDG
ncbi:hypothetical protein NE237_027972 [Protea cynaroides]|uniref:Transposase MuDR plant domain-containing protein n=1 Tax=Protea cynaroides TaxID=273540 RepID=A0A9Q0JUQ0_9MAGN|nr:hypothetical protein NE237_027972 [Protea cynaroides]